MMLSRSQIPEQIQIALTIAALRWDVERGSKDVRILVTLGSIFVLMKGHSPRMEI